MSETTDDMIPSFYQNRHVFCTGANGMLGTAYLSKLLLDTPVSRVYALVRGGESRLWKIWASHLPSKMLVALKASGKLVVFDGDITRPNCGLSPREVNMIQDTVSIFVHGASSINLKQPLGDVSRTVIYPSLAIGKMALACPHLSRFVYVSTAYCSTFLQPTSDGRVEGFDATIMEDVRALRNNDAISSATVELAELGTLGSTPEYEMFNFPYAYSYAKHLTERLLIQCFRDAQSDHKLLIFRPSIIGPAESFPYPFFEIPGSSPMTTVAACWILNSPTKSLVSSHLSDPSHARYDEIPVDMVVNRLIVHVAFGSIGCVHAVGGADHQRSTEDLLAASATLRRFWWGRPTVVWGDCDWKSNVQCFFGHIFVVTGCAFIFDETKTKQAWGQMSSDEKSSWPLWACKNLSTYDYVTGRKKNIALLVRQMVPRSLGLPGSLSGLFMSSSSRL